MRKGRSNDASTSVDSSAPQQPTIDHQAAFDTLATQYLELKAEAEARLREVGSAATHLLTSFQSQGYEVAAGLDLLQDDLEELEAVHTGQDEEGEEGGEPVAATPVRAPMPAMGVNGTPPPVSPGTEKMVVLKARREHVEGAFLELVRAMVGGLERLVTLAAVMPVPSSTTTTEGGAAPTTNGGAA